MKEHFCGSMGASEDFLRRFHTGETTVDQGHIGIESLLSKEAWRFSQRGVRVVSKLLEELFPYQDRLPLNIGDIVELAEESECLLAVDLNRNGAIIGITRLLVKAERDGSYGVLHDIVVDEAYRRQGVGKALTTRAIDEARQLHLRHIDLTCKPAREAAIAMYEKLGFKLVTAADPAVAGSENLYRLILPEARPTRH